MVLQALAMQISVARDVLETVRPRDRHARERSLLETIRQWDRRATAPAMLIAWITGLYLANQGDWFGDRWLTLKLACVIALAALHGLLAGKLRRFLETETANSPPASPLTLAGLFGLMGSIVLLVVVKPYF
jgi:uncharacterized membrane protein